MPPQNYHVLPYAGAQCGGNSVETMVRKTEETFFLVRWLYHMHRVSYMYFIIAEAIVFEDIEVGLILVGVGTAGNRMKLLSYPAPIDRCMLKLTQVDVYRT